MFSDVQMTSPLTAHLTERHHPASEVSATVTFQYLYAQCESARQSQV